MSLESTLENHARFLENSLNGKLLEEPLAKVYASHYYTGNLHRVSLRLCTPVFALDIVDDRDAHPDKWVKEDNIGNREGHVLTQQFAVIEKQVANFLNDNPWPVLLRSLANRYDKYADYEKAKKPIGVWMQYYTSPTHTSSEGLVLVPPVRGFGEQWGSSFLERLCTIPHLDLSHATLDNHWPVVRTYITKCLYQTPVCNFARGVVGAMLQYPR